MERASSGQGKLMSFYFMRPMRCGHCCISWILLPEITVRLLRELLPLPQCSLRPVRTDLQQFAHEPPISFLIHSTKSHDKSNRESIVSSNRIENCRESRQLIRSACDLFSDLQTPVCWHQLRLQLRATAHSARDLLPPLSCQCNAFNA